MQYTLSEPRPLLTIKQFSAKYPAWTQAALRNLIFHSQDRETPKGYHAGNGLDLAIIRIGKKILIDENEFFRWVDRKQLKILRKLPQNYLD